MRSSFVVRGMSATAAVLLMTACSGDSDENDAASSSTSAASSSAAESSSEATATDADFCTQASEIVENITSSLTQSGSDSLAENLTTVAEQIGAIEPPDEIADDWTALGNAIGKAADALEGVDITNPDEAAQAQAELGELQEQLGDAGTNVDAYLRDECGIDTDGTETSTESAAPSS